jgi:hypothetical protein
VQFASEADWEGLEKVVVGLKAADLPAAFFTFDGPSKMMAVNLDMPDPTQRRFRYRVARTWSSGSVEEDDWIETETPVVLVGRVSANKLLVDVVPVGPELPEAGVVLIEVDLSYIDAANQVRDIQKAVLRAKADRFRWEVQLKDPQRRRYDYQVTVHRTSGQTQMTPWRSSTERILAIPVTRS